MNTIKNQSRRPRNNRRNLTAVLRSAIEPLEARTLLSTYYVNTLSDATAPGPGLFTLRQAVAAANAHAGPDSIYFRMDLFATPGIKTVTLMHGEIDFNDPTGATMLTGAANRLVVDGNHAGRVFGIVEKSSVTLFRVAVTNGVAGLIDNTNAEGGGIFNAGMLTLNSVTISNCSATGVASTVSEFAPQGQGLGGGIFSRGPLTLVNSTVTANRATGASNEESDDNFETFGGLGAGAGIYSLGPLTVKSSVISDNIATGGTADKPVHFDDGTVGGPAMGGGVFDSVAVTITSSTISGNSAIGGNASSAVSSGGGATGGGIFTGMAVTISNSTFSSNTAQGGTASQQPFAIETSNCSGGSALGGGLYSNGAITLTGATFSANKATGGPGGVPLFAGAGGNALGGAVYGSVSISATGSSFAANSATGGNVGGDDPSAPAGAARGGAIYSTGPATLQSSSVTKNTATGGDAMSWGTGGNASGGGVYAQAALAISQSNVSQNTATGGVGAAGGLVVHFAPVQGGGVYSSTTLSLTQSTLSNNTARGGGAMFETHAFGDPSVGGGAYVGTAATIIQSTIAGNNVFGSGGNDFGAPAYGGGLYAQNEAIITGSTISGNAATGGSVTGDQTDPLISGGGGTAQGGGVWCGSGALVITNSAVANNSAIGGTGIGTDVSGSGIGGGIFAIGTVKLYNSTISANTTKAGGNPVPGTASGGGIAFTTSGALLDNTIVSANKAGGAFSDINGTTNASSANNLIGIGGGLTNGVNGNKIGVTDPKLAALGNYGGPTQTMPPLIGSPAIDAGSNSLIPAGFTLDQRGFPRIVGGKVDIGAVEFSKIVISGAVYNDINGDGARQAGEPGMANVQVYVDLTNAGIFVAGDPVATTGALGNYVLTFAPLTVKGSLIIREVRPPTMRRTQPAGIYPLGFYTISSTASAVSNINFGNSLTALVTGTVYHDTNANGKLNSGEAGLFAWNVHASYVANNVHIVKTILTDTGGNYSFVLPPGACTITESVQPGFARTKPGAAGYMLTLATGATVTGQNFGNK